LLELKTDNKAIDVVVRWRPEDLASGVTDLEIYPFLKGKGCNLYVNSKIHLKLYIFESNSAITTSANLTAAGMFVSANSNVETGSHVKLNVFDWGNISALLDTSFLITDDHYNAIKSALQQYNSEIKPNAVKPFAGVPVPPAKRFLISCLPAAASPDEIFTHYLTTPVDLAEERGRRIIHDLLIYKIPKGLSKKELEVFIHDRFTTAPFITEFIKQLQLMKSMSFGAVTAWIHNECEDVPVPYRKDLKICVQNLYTWLAWAYPENISWNRPNYSQVIYWKDSP